MSEPLTDTTDSPILKTEDKWCRLISRAPAAKVSREFLKDIRRAMAINAMFWPPNSAITYGFLGTAEEATEYRKERVRAALDRYQEHSSLTFRHVDITGWDFDHADSRNKCEVRISFGDPIIQADGSITWGWSFDGIDCRKLAYDPAE
ncbi:hypothetical protein B0H13DRAFT_2358368 [Mycena leptocephala]|nr:hypothetical protein B0H13DRAFT_2358368 [Mycena leptocephala]